MAGLPDDHKEALTELRRRVAAPQVLCHLYSCCHPKLLTMHTLSPVQMRHLYWPCH